MKDSTSVSNLLLLSNLLPLTFVVVLLSGCNLGGSIVGLEGEITIIEANRGEQIQLTQDGNFIFNGNYNLGSTFDVRILEHSSELFQRCAIKPATGRFLFSDILNVRVTCTTPQEIPGATASSIWFDETRGHLWLTSPDDQQLVQLDSNTLEPLERINLNATPSLLSYFDDKLMIATDHHAIIWNLQSQQEEARIALPCGGVTNALAVPANNMNTTSSQGIALCNNDDRFVLFNLDNSFEQRVFSFPQGATSLIKNGEYLVINDSGSIARFNINLLKSQPTYGDGADQLPMPISLPPEIEDSILDDGAELNVTTIMGLTMNRFGELGAVFQQVNNNDRSRSPEQGGYGSVIDGEPRIEPRTMLPCGSRYAVFDGGAKVFSGPSALGIAAEHNVAWVVNRYTQNVSVLACTPYSEDNDEQWIGDREYLQQEISVIGQFRIGPGARGIALSKSGLTAYVDVGFHHAVAKLSISETVLDGSELLFQPDLVVNRIVTSHHFSDLAQQGRRLFFDGNNTHLTPSGVITCATCHPAGSADRLNWFIQTESIPRKFRRTQPAWTAKNQLLPFHWDGEFTQSNHLIQTTISQLLDGDGLLVDLSAMAAYMEELTPPPMRPTESWETTQVAAGEALFNGRCSSCHVGDLYTDNLLHAVVSDSSDADANIIAANTPSLVGVRAGAPYLHDGRAKSLADVIDLHNPLDLHGTTSDLSPEQKAALLRFLESI